MKTTLTDPVEIGRRYDQSSPISDVFNDGQVHLAYSYGADDETPMAEAAKRITRKVAQALGLRPGEHLLDAGCGLGAPAILVARETGARVTGVTISEFELHAATGKAKESGLAGQVDFRLGDFSALPFPDATFDAVLAIESLQCAPDLGRALAELFRALRPGGRISVADYTLEGPWTAQIDRFVADMGSSRLPTLPGWCDALRQAGFAVEEYTQCGHRVFGMPSKYLEAVDKSRDKLAAGFGDEMAVGLKQALRDFFTLGPESIGYAIVSARKPAS